MLTAQVTLEMLQRLSVFHDIPQENLTHLASAMVRRTYAAGEIIFIEGEPSIGVWFIAEGRVRIIKHSLSGRVQTLCLANAGRCFGSCPLFNNDTNPASAQALDNVTLLVLPHHELNNLIHTDSHLAAALLKIYSQRFAHLARLSEGLGTWTVANRINDCLITYADWEAVPPVVLLTHERLAALAGTVREVVTRHLSQLEKKGSIRQEPGRIILLDTDALHGHCPPE